MNTNMDENKIPPYIISKNFGSGKICSMKNILINELI